MAQNKKTLILKVGFTLVDWVDDTHVPEFCDVAETLKIISMYRQTPEVFTKGQTKIISKWLTKNSVEKFLKAKQQAEKHQAMLAQDGEIANDMMFFKRLNTNH